MSKNTGIFVGTLTLLSHRVLLQQPIDDRVYLNKPIDTLIHTCIKGLPVKCNTPF
jgi:hypothetical protein